MSQFAAFTLTYSALLCALACMGAWAVRKSTAHIALKLAVPALTVAAALSAPATIRAWLGYPVEVAQAELPPTAELLGFMPHDAEHTVDLWLRTGGPTPRAYTTRLTEQLKRTLEAARARMAQGEPVELAQKPAGARQPGAPPRDAYTTLGDDQREFVLEDWARSALPPKEGAQ